jgi:protein-disulfide isomerase
VSDGRDLERRRKLLQLASAAAFIAIIAVAVLIVVKASETSGGDTNLEGVAEVRSELAGIGHGGTMLGDSRASVKLVEFGDLQCPVCRVTAERSLPQVIDSTVRGGRAVVEFRNLTIIGDESVPAGAAAIAAGRQGLGWAFVQLFYRNQGNENSGYVTDAFLTAIARAVGVRDIARWNRERRSARIIGQVRASTAEAERLGFHGTPSFAVEGPGTDGLEPKGFLDSPGQIEAAIESAE